MNILVVYGTNSGGTYQAAMIIDAALAAAGHNVSIKAAKDTHPDEFSRYDAVVLGSCSWDRVSSDGRLQGQLQEHMRLLVEAAKDLTFPHQHFAVFGLGDSSYSEFCTGADRLETFVHHLGGQLASPVLRIDKFFYDLPQNRETIRSWAAAIVKQWATAR